MTKRILLFTLTSFIFLAFSSFIYAQEKSSYDFTFLKAIKTDTTDQKDVLVLFHVSAKNKKDWSPVLSMRLTYSLDDEKEKTIDLMKSKEAISIAVNGRSIIEKDTALYNLVKDKIDVNAKEDFWVLEFRFRDISATMVKKMTLTYGFWEKRHYDIRVEKKFDFDIE